MKQSILNKFTAPITENPQEIISENSKEVRIQNGKFQLSVHYMGNTITGIDVTITESREESDKISFSIDKNSRSMVYYTSKISDLYEKGLGYILVKEHIEKEDRIEDYLGALQIFLRKRKGTTLNGLDISFESLNDPNSENTKWLIEHEIYDVLIKAEELMNCLSELLIGNNVTTKELKKLMEEGSLYKCEEDREEHVIETEKLQ